MASENLNPLRQFEGTSVLDYLDVAQSLEEQDRTIFLNDISLVAHTDSHGIPGVIDAGDEAVALAQLFIKHYPTAFPKSITSADIGEYLTNLWSRSGPQAVELEIESILHRIQDNPSLKEVAYRGKTYSLYKDDITTVLNNNLAESGSSHRVFIVTRENGKQSALYGRMASEEVKDHNGREVRLITIRHAEMKIGFEDRGLVPAVNNQNSTIMVIQDEVNGALVDRFRNRKLYRSLNYRPEVHQKVYVEFSKETQRPGGLKTIQGALEKFLTAHEWAHFETLAEFGKDLADLRTVFLLHGENTIYDLEEVYADLSVIQQMIDLARSDEKEAMRLFYLMSILRGRGPTSEECISNLLLSVARIEGDSLVVDWKLFQNRLDSFRGALRGVFIDFKDHLVRLSDRTVQFDGDAEEVILQYRKQVNDWMADHLGLDPALVPFKIQ